MNEMPKMNVSNYLSNSLHGREFTGFAKQLDDEFNQNEIQKLMTKNTKRIVRVYVADTDSSVPLENSLLYSGDEKFTDATDQELFYEVPINDLLQKHNAARITLPDKSRAKDSVTRNLEPIKIRDLTMTVVVIAVF